jgi:hypothetical protein
VGAAVLRVVATHRLWVRAWIDETALGQLAALDVFDFLYHLEDGQLAAQVM